MSARGRTPWTRGWALGLASFAAAATASATPIGLPGFPLVADGPIREAVALADIDHDGTTDVVAVYGSTVTVISTDVKVLPGWPVDLASITKRAVTVVGPPAVGDIDGDGRPDVALALSFGNESDGLLVALRFDGKLLWQVPLPKGPGAGCSMADLTARHANDVIVGTRAGQLVAINASGKEVAGFPVKLGSPASSPVAFGSLARGQKPVLAVGASDGKVYVVSVTGQAVPGFPLTTNFAVTGAPAFGDIDDDGQNDLVVASQDFSVYAVRADGTSLPGFPVATQYRIYGGPALGDLDHDGKLDVVVASSDGKVYAWNNRGRLFPNFPVTAGAKLDRGSTVVLADSSRTGKDSIFLTSTDGNVYAFDGSGAALDGFPLRIAKDGEVASSPTVADFVPDESEELLIGKTGGVEGYRLDRSGPLPQSPLSWPAPGHDAARQSHTGPNPPRYRNPVFTPATPRLGEPMRLSYEYYSLDGAPEPVTRIRWTANGQPVPELDDKKEVPGARMRRGERWRATIQAPSDYAVYKDGSGGTVLATADVLVGNPAPSAVQIALDPVLVSTIAEARAKIVVPSTTPDGGAVTYVYRWEHNGRVVSTQPTLKPGQTHKGERWRLVVTPTDGEKAGPEAKVDFVVVNTVPTAPGIALGPSNPTVEDDLAVTIAKPATDADNDALTYHYAFYVNGQRRAFPSTRGLLPKGSARHGDVVKVEAWAHDGEADGIHASAEARYVNSAPKQPQVAIAPATPRTREGLTAGLIVAGRDPDRDPVRYQVRWFRNGEPFGAANQFSIPETEIHKGQKWSVEFVPSDGTLAGPPGRFDVVVANSAPSRPRLAASNVAPTVTDTTTITIAEESVDRDGDPVHYEFAWSVDGKPVFGSAAVVVASAPPAATGKSAGGARSSANKTTLTPGEFRKGQRILVQVTAIDPDGARGPVGTIEIAPRNTPPGAPRVTLEPAEPTIESGLRAVIATAAEDRDGDSVVYRYRWYRDGVEAKDIGDRAHVKPGELKHGEAWHVQVTPFDGEAEGTPTSAKALVRNTGPVAPVVVVGPRHPSVVTGLSCDVKQPATDADGDALTLEYRWYRDGQPFAVPSTSAAVPGEAVRAGETWRCDVIAHDADAESKIASSQALIENAAPSIPAVLVDPPAPRAGDALVCVVATEAVDPDGDRVSYEYRWESPVGVKLPALEDPARLPSKLVRKGEVWRCGVTANAGQHKTPAPLAEARIGNTPPKPPVLSLEPVAAVAGSDLRCSFAVDASDVDGDRLAYAFVWYRNGTAQSFAPTSAEVPGRLVKTGDRWSCGVTVNDGTDTSPATQSGELTVSAPARRP
jgi:hypothetical protein